MSYLIIVGFDRKTNEPITESLLVQKFIYSICRSQTIDLAVWLRNDFGFFNESKYKEQIEEMYTLLSENIPSLKLDQNKTAWLKEYWIVDCLYTALSKCFPQLSFQDIVIFQERWLDVVYSGQPNKLPLHPKLGTKGHENIICEICHQMTVPFKVRVNVPNLPLPTTPRYCPECYENNKCLYYIDLNGKQQTFKQNIKVHKL